MTDQSTRDRALKVARDIADGLISDAHIRSEVGVALHSALDTLKEETETCHFNCRKRQTIYMDGFNWGFAIALSSTDQDALEAWKEYEKTL